MQTNGSGFFLDAQALSGLKQRAHDDQGAALAEVAGQFEGLFVQMMLKSMREASAGEELFSGEQSDYYRELLDRQMATDLSAGGGIGIAAALIRQLQPGLPNAGAATAAIDTAPLRRFAGAALGVATDAPLRSATDTLATPSEDWNSPIEFVQSVYPQAEKVARRLGLDPALLVAQSALETGWGGRVARHADGSNSFALFGIKADSRWDGERVSIDTLEFDGASFQPERAAFRAYPSVADALTDYAEFLADNGRYRAALSSADDPRAYLQSLQDAGYATDPQYADKIWRIYRGDTLRAGLDGMATVDDRNPAAQG